ncbi:hypothetical protein SAY87_016867 [Trapa incisa]|uniref:Uncharacterized protein n=1 Tax=Trapa incisa TaxID=236973 RepID=A0AAN7L7J4_9MYRT|nr:hypothetical protein SAY87_016867 [Trapa incisa]
MSVLTACNQQQLPWIPIISALGFLILLGHLISFVRGIITITSPFRPLKDLRSRYGSWAIVTGCTDGIGRAFAFNLSQKGMNLILVSRSRDKLERLSEELLAVNEHTLVRILALDFAEDVSDGVRELAKVAKVLEVGLLINNVGVTYPAARFFHEVDDQLWRRIVRVNIEWMAKVTRAVLPEMLRRGRGAIINLGSGASIVVPSHPLFTVYAATKAFVDQLSRCLHVEYEPYGIDVQCQIPLYVATKMASRVASIEESSTFVPSPEDYAEAAVRCIGYGARCMPYWSHAVQWFLASMAPESFLDSWRLSLGLNRRAHNPPACS